MIYGYVRVSTDKQDVESQKIGVNRKAAELGGVVGEWITDDGVSGVKEYSERMLGALMGKVESGDIIIVSELSRLARSVFMLFRIVEQLTQVKNVVVYAVKEGQTIKKDDVASAILISAYGVAAQIEREMISKRTKEGLERRKAEGVVLGRPKGKAKIESLKLSSRIATIQEMATGGKHSLTTAARKLGVNRDTLTIFLKKAKIKWTWDGSNPCPARKNRNKRRYADIIEKYNRGITVREISKWYDLSDNAIREIIKKAKQ